MRATAGKKTRAVDVSIMRCPITKQSLVYSNSSLLETFDGCYKYAIKDGTFFSPPMVRFVVPLVKVRVLQ
jgi:hypothetical protein